VLAQPETGRLHQVRRHFHHISHPIVGDVNYGSGAINRQYRARYGLHRLALHARSIAFDHPTTGERIVTTAPIPDDLSRALEALELNRAAPAVLPW
jgi:tRNA pseudouridine65 synthase